MPTALLPAIPARPADRPETFEEYRARREAIALHRQFADDLFGWLDKNPLPDFDPFEFFSRMHCGGYAVVPEPAWMPRAWTTISLPIPPAGFKPWP